MKTNEEYVEEFKHKFSGEDSFISRYDYDIIDWLLTTLEAKDKECEERVREERERCIKIVEGEFILYPDTGKVQESEYNYSLLNAVNSLKALTPTKTDKHEADVTKEG